MSSSQSAEVADKRVDGDEYRAAFERYRSCLKAGGYDLLIGPEINKSIEYSVPAEAVDSGIDRPCYEREFMQVDKLWQLAHIDGSESARVIRECVIANGLTPHDREKDNYKELEEAGISHVEC